LPALTASQVVARLGFGGGDEALVHGAGGVTGGSLVALAAAGCRVVATCPPRAADRVRGYGASAVVDYHAADWPTRALRAASGRFSVALNAVRGGAPALLPLLVADRGRLATITGGPPQGERGIQVIDAYVVPD
jgi:NADPH:quinone reductase-like Zn-dependent oxidoreductase